MCAVEQIVRSAFFFFQAEDGIRDYKVTGVQTCALPISLKSRKARQTMKHLDKALIGAGAALLLSGGIAAAALGPSNIGTVVMASLPGDVALAVNNNIGHNGGPGFLTTAATYIGVTEAALRTELATGKSLA